MELKAVLSLTRVEGLGRKHLMFSCNFCSLDVLGLLEGFKKERGNRLSSFAGKMGFHLVGA